LAFKHCLQKKGGIQIFKNSSLKESEEYEKEPQIKHFLALRFRLSKSMKVLGTKKRRKKYNGNVRCTKLREKFARGLDPPAALKRCQL
jgi:hypothetical protein